MNGGHFLCELLTVYIQTTKIYILKWSPLSLPLQFHLAISLCAAAWLAVRYFVALQCCKDNIIKWVIDWNTDKGRSMLIGRCHYIIDQWFIHRLNGWLDGWMDWIPSLIILEPCKRKTILHTVNWLKCLNKLIAMAIWTCLSLTFTSRNRNEKLKKLGIRWKTICKQAYKI